jgi:hypothetical protein
MPSIARGYSSMESTKPLVEVLIEGELSPFEHEALYQLLRKRFQLEQPSYVDLPDEGLASRINIVFHHPYTLELFTVVLRESWRDLKELFKQVRHRRGRAGAAFNLTFIDGNTRLVFRSGLLTYDEMSSAMDQVGHLTSIIRQMTKVGTAQEPLALIECIYDRASDRWHEFRGFILSDGKRAYRFDETEFRWNQIV